MRRHRVQLFAFLCTGLLLSLGTPVVTAADEDVDSETTATTQEVTPAEAKAALSGEKLDMAIKDAAEAQNYLQEADEKVVSKEVKQAPAAVLANSDGDIATTGACKESLIDFCQEVQPGAGRLADCLSAQLTEEGKEGYSGKKVSAKCVQELDAFKIDRAQNINKNVPLAKACKEDAEKFCKDISQDEAGAVVTCLREKKDELSEKCAAELLEEMKEAADDFRKDPRLLELCKEDADVVCPGIDPKDGAVQECLRKHRPQLSWDCQDELFRQDVENADDIRLSVKLFKKCLGDKRKFCPEVAPGNARAKECLEEHRNDDGFSEDCRKELEHMIEVRVGDFRLDPIMRKECGDDVENLCAFQKESLDTGTELDARVVLCLQDYRDEIENPSCAKRVHKYIELASEDIRFNVPLAEACHDDRVSLCNQVQPGSARVIRCLQNRRDRLSYDCKAALFDQEVLMSENIDFNYPMKQACNKEIDEFCKDVPHGHARVIRCLSDHKSKETFGTKCKDEVLKFEERSSTDYRLNWSLEKACEDTLPQLCGDICDRTSANPCGGKVLRCLVEKYENITNQECRSEVFYFIKMEVKDFRNDVILAESCRPDVDKFCANVQPGEGRVHSCLQEHRDELSSTCRSEEIKLMVRQAANVEFVPSISKSCHEEMNVFCKGVQPGKARMFHCLLVSAQQPDFSNNCRSVLIKQVHKRTRDWRLDYGLQKYCGGDVPKLCASEAKDADRGTGIVIKCLITKVDSVSEGCARELSRVVSTALQFYEPNNPITSPCDDDVEKLCIKDKMWEHLPIGVARSCLTGSVFIVGGGGGGGNISFDLQNMPKGGVGGTAASVEGSETAATTEAPATETPTTETPATETPATEAATTGAEGTTTPVAEAEASKEGGSRRLLLEWIAREGFRRLQAVNKLGDLSAVPRSKHLSDTCAHTVLISVMGERAYGSFEAALSSNYLLGQLKNLNIKYDGITGDSPESSSGFVLQGWWALLGMLALATILVAGGFFAYRKYYGPEKAYTAVVKNASV